MPAGYRLPLSRPPMNHVHVQSLAEAWLAMLRRLCLFGIYATHEEGEPLANCRYGERKRMSVSWPRPRPRLKIRYINKGSVFHRIPNLEKQHNNFRPGTQHQFYKTTIQSLSHLSHNNFNSFFGTMGATVDTWTCCRCGMGGMVYQTTLQCLEANCQHQRCANCSYFVDSVGPTKSR